MKDELTWLEDYRKFLVSNDLDTDEEIIIKVEERIVELKKRLKELSLKKKPRKENKEIKNARWIRTT